MENNPLPAAPTGPRHRCDGWTTEIQKAFIEALADSGCVRHAAESVGRSHTSAYRLRTRPGGELFARAWRAALNLAYSKLRATALRRVNDGLEHRVYDGDGRLVARRVSHSDKLLMFLLDHTRPGENVFESAHFDPPSEFYMNWEDNYGAALAAFDGETPRDYRPLDARRSSGPDWNPRGAAQPSISPMLASLTDAQIMQVFSHGYADQGEDGRVVAELDRRFRSGEGFDDEEGEDAA